MNLPFFNKPDKNLYTLAFYNVENLFDIYDDPNTADDSFLPTSERRWTKKRYLNKLYKLGSAISKIGKKRTGDIPAIVGLCEVENKIVLQDLINTKHLKKGNYGIVHYDSKDERGIDVALIYKKSLFKIITSKSFSIDITVDPKEPDYTRDILLVTGLLNHEKITLIVTHWSSRREGVKETEYKRLIASDKILEIVEKLQDNEPDAKVIIMGDFNDDPNSKSIQQLVHGLNLFNPMETMLSYSRGTLNHRFQWNIFDQIMFTTNFFEIKKGAHSFSKADIFDRKFLTQYRGKYKGHPFRTFVGPKYKGGYSDHFPVFIQLRQH